MTTTLIEKPLPSAAVEAIHRGSMLEAIKIVRTESGLGLKESKDVVEAYLRDNRDNFEFRQALEARSSEARRKLLTFMALLAGGALLVWLIVSVGHRP